LKIAVLTSRFPYPLEKGDKLRLFYQVKELSKHHEIVLCSLTHSNVSVQDISELNKYCSRIYLLKLSVSGVVISLLRSIFSKMPLQVAYFYNPYTHKKFLQIIEQEKPEHCYFQLIRTAPYSFGVPFRKTLDYMDSFSLWTRKISRSAAFPLNLLLKLEAFKVKSFEISVASEFDTYCIISAQDRNNMPALLQKQLHIVPNGVDTFFFKPSGKFETKYDIAFIGNLGYYNNIKAAEYLVKEILPDLLSWKSDIQVLIAGARPATAVLNLAGPNVTIRGWMADIREAYNSSKIIVAPVFLAVGMQNKILEAMALGLPCITTPSVNSAIGAKPGEEILLAENAHDFREFIKLLLVDEKLLERVGQGGLSLVRKEFTWVSAVDKLHIIIMNNN
jgi:glycosyltransferase involved in cell wall biosynthesis